MDVGLFIYIDGVVMKIDTFNDEPISVTSSLQNVNDITKTFTDYSQSFSVPISKNNNLIFSHWYNNEVDNGFDQRLRYDGFIEIDSQVFRVGRWQIESSDVTKSYRITFFGVLKSLADKFGEDKLKDLDYSPLQFDYTFANVLNRLTTIRDVQFPLISSERVWTYGGGGDTDISQNSHAIDYRELFPAVKVSKILEFMEAKYSINFEGNFLNQTQFRNAFLWFKNKDKMDFTSIPQQIDLTGFNSGTLNGWIVDYTNNSITTTGSDIILRYVNLVFNPTISNTTNITVLVYRNGNLFSQQTFQGWSTLTNILTNPPNGTYTFFVSTTTALTALSGSLLSLDASTVTTDTTAFIDVSLTTDNFLDLSLLAPDLTIKDFFNGLIRQFNWIVESFDEVNYKLMPLDDWYQLGKAKDLTKYITTDSEVERFKVFKKVDFLNKESKSFTNNAFKENFQRIYGDLTDTFENEGGELKIETPFEALLFARLAQWLLVGYSIDKDGRPYVPAPCLLYRTLEAPVTVPTFYLTGSPATAITSYVPFSRVHFQLFTTNRWSLDWGVEVFQEGGVPISESAYWTYYSNYLNNLYQKKTRILKCEAILPTTDLVSLRLNDFIIIRDKRYLINQFTTDFLKKKVSFELITDFRDANQVNVQNAVTVPDSLIEVPILDGDTSWSVTTDTNSIIRSFIVDNGSLQISTDPTNVGDALLTSSLGNLIIVVSR